MKRLDNALANYLERETDYAMMITGKWGSGKTYYYENVLKKKIIEKTPTLVKDNNKNFKPILVSLYGLKSLEEVKKSIILSLIPLSNISENKWLKLGSNFVTSVLGATNINIGFNDNLSIKTDLGKVMSKSDIDKDDWINLEDLVICFDDLERIHPTFDIQELIGYINHIVETAKAKILIIANDKEIEDEKFKVLKEKTIGISIEFIPDFDTMYQSIIDNSIVKDTQYHIFLEKKKELVKTVFGENSENYRILIFALNHFQNIYSELSPFLANNKEKESFLNSKKQEILEKLLRFTIAISIEYREGKISYGDRKGLNLYYPPIYQKIASLEEKRVLSSEDKDYLSKYKRYTKCIESIKNKYNVRFNSDFINSIYGYVTGGNVLKIDELVKEIKSQYDVENEILGKLHYEQVLKHSDEEYKNLTKQMLNFAYEGKYKLEHYYYIFQYAFRFENPLNLNAEKVEKNIIEGIKKGKKNDKYKIEDLRWLTLDVTKNLEEIHKKYSNNLDNIRKVILDMAENLQKEDVKAKFTRLILGEELKHIGNKVANYQDQPIFNLFIPKKLYLQFKNNNNSIRYNIVSFFEKRYETISDKHLKEENFMLELQKFIQEDKESWPQNGVSHIHFNNFSKKITEIINHIEGAKIRQVTMPDY